MKLHNRILSAFLAVVLMLGSFGVITVSAASDDPDQIILNTYTTKVFNTPQEKLKTMKMMLEEDGYRLYVDAVSGETAVENIATGELLFSNPYDIATAARTNSIRKQALSQIFIQYLDIEKNVSKELYSFEEAAMRQQISVMSIKNGVRVEYVIGQEETRKLCPRWPVMWKKEDAKPKLCFMGCPHMSLQQLKDWTDKLDEGLKAAGNKKVQIPTVFTASPAVLKEFEKTGYAVRLKAIGVITSYICPLMYMNNPLCKKMPVITSSNKLRTYTTARYYTDDEILATLTKGGLN